MKKLLVIAAVSMLAACKSLFVCDVDEAKFSNKEVHQKVVLEARNGMFALNSAELTKESKVVLDGVAAKLAKKSKVNVEIDGYTDSTGNEAYNVSLSKKRADAAADYLKSKGVAEKRITTKGHGPKNPVASNDTAEGRAKNRRVEIVYK